MQLSGLNILVTRPEGQAQGLLRAIGEAGGSACHYPVLAITPLDTALEAARAQTCKELMMNLDHFQHVIFISGNAVYYGLEWINEYWPQLPVGIQWYGIGKTTSAALLRAGVPVDSAEPDQDYSMNSEALLRHPALAEIVHDRVLIVRGVGGREYLQQQLSERGARVSYAECYRRAKVGRPSGELAAFIDQRAIDVCCVNSGDSLDFYCELIGDNQLGRFRHIVMLVPGQRVAQMARARGFQHIIQARNASDESVLTALLDYARTQ